MSPRLLFDDLFPYGSRSIAHLRLFAPSDASRIALVVEPTDNPGQSAINAAEVLWAAIERAFPATEPLRLFISVAPFEPGWTEVCVDSGAASFGEVGSTLVEAAVGGSVVVSVAGACVDLGGAGHPLLALVRPEESPREPLSDFAVLPVSDLPWAHNPFQCRFRERFDALESAYPPGAPDAGVVGAHWFRTLQADDFRACHHRRADWNAVAATAVAVWRETRCDGSIEDALRLIADRLESGDDAAACTSLFTHPIVWAPGHPTLTNGQHRACALRAARADFCVVDVGGAAVGDRYPVDPRRRAAADIAAYWAAVAGRDESPV